MTPTVCIFDNHARFSGLLLTLLRNEFPGLVRAIGSFAELLRFATRHRGVIYVIHLEAGGIDALEATSRLLEADSSSTVFVVTPHDFEAFRAKALEAGAQQAIFVGRAREELIPALRARIRSRLGTMSHV